VPKKRGKRDKSVNMGGGKIGSREAERGCNTSLKKKKIVTFFGSQERSSTLGGVREGSYQEKRVDLEDPRKLPERQRRVVPAGRVEAEKWANAVGGKVSRHLTKNCESWAAFLGEMGEGGWGKKRPLYLGRGYSRLKERDQFINAVKKGELKRKRKRTGLKGKNRNLQQVSTSISKGIFESQGLLSMGREDGDPRGKLANLVEVFTENRALAGEQPENSGGRNKLPRTGL